MREIDEQDALLFSVCSRIPGVLAGTRLHCRVPGCAQGAGYRVDRIDVSRRAPV